MIESMCWIELISPQKPFLLLKSIFREQETLGY